MKKPPIVGYGYFRESPILYNRNKCKCVRAYSMHTLSHIHTRHGSLFGLVEDSIKEDTFQSYLFGRQRYSLVTADKLLLVRDFYKLD